MEGVLSLNHSRSFWSQRYIKIVLAAIALIVLPIYLYIGMQPAVSLDFSSYPVLEIDTIGLATPVAPVELKDHQLTAPDTIAGVYQQQTNKRLIIGHSSTVFQKLSGVAPGDHFTYDESEYIVTTVKTLAKSEIAMSEILAAETKDTIIIMTCAGESLPNQDATHRLLVTAVANDSSTLATLNE